MLLEVDIHPLDFGIVLMLILLCYLSVAILVQLACVEQGRTQSLTSQHVEGNGNITVSTGSGSTVNINTCPQDGSKEDHTTSTSTQCSEKECTALVLAVPKPIGTPRRLNTKTQKTCRQFIDNFAMLSAKGKVTECRQTIVKLLKAKTDPDFQVSLRHGASQNAINAGNLEEASRLLREIESILPETSHETEHRLRWYHQKSFLKLRARKYGMGLLWVQEALPLIETVAPGCITGWLLVNHAWFLTEIAAGQDEEDRRFLMKKAETDYQHAIEHAESEDPKQMLHFQSRLPQFAKIGLALMYLGCRESCDNSRLGIISKDVSLEDIRKAKNVIASLDKEGMLCNISKFLLKVVKSCLLYRQGSYQQAYDLALEARDFATEHSFGGFANFAKSIVNYLQDYV